MLQESADTAEGRAQDFQQCPPGLLALQCINHFVQKHYDRHREVNVTCLCKYVGIYLVVMKLVQIDCWMYYKSCLCSRLELFTKVLKLSQYLFALEVCKQHADRAFHNTIMSSACHHSFFKQLLNLCRT